ncbi:MAG: hypothetical protein ACD_73C00511G0002 [uncultured bacterium]|nr:MAG: hypothetical protein ACD_73C00511G0002 [uncultured bacterium]
MQNILVAIIVMGALAYLFSYFKNDKPGADISLFDGNHESCAGCILPKLFKNPH